MAKILSTNNAQLFRQLGSKQFRNLPAGTIEHEVVASGAALLEATRRSRPAIVMIDALLPDTSGYDVCRAIKEDPELARTRVMLILDNPAVQEQLRAAEASRCDDIICLPAPGDELYGHIAPFLGFPDTDSRRVQEKLIAELDLGKSKARGEVLDLAEGSARLRLAERVTASGKITVKLSRAVTGATHTLLGAMSWQRQSSTSGEWEAGLSFSPLPSEVLARLRASCLWEVSPTTEGGVLVVMRGDLVESVSFAPLLERLQIERKIDLDMAGVRRLNSVGACRWAETVQLLRGRQLSFLRCSLEFTSHAAMTTGMLGQGRVESTFAPYVCTRCGQTEMRLLQVAAVVDGSSLRPPLLGCSHCNGELEFDDIPERYFSFLIT